MNKKIVTLVLSTFFLFSIGCGSKNASLLDNTEIVKKGFVNTDAIYNIGDPYIIENDGKYFVTATAEGKGYDIYSTEDLKNWTKEGRIFSADFNKGWVRSSLWQPQIVKGSDEKFYLYYCGNNDNGSLRIGVACSDSITGPYEDVYDHPLFETGYATIDPCFYTDDDGKMYLFFSRDCSENFLEGYHTSQLYGIEMASNTELKEGTKPTLLITPEQDWELVTGDYRWNEGPDMIKKDGLYYLFYSGGCYADKTYSMGYAVSKSPLGPYEKYENNPIIASTDEMSGPGNNSFFYSPDDKELYTCYHTHTIKMVGGGDRKVTIDKCGFREDGSFYMDGPTAQIQAPISGIGGFRLIDNIKSVEGVGTADGVSDNALIDGENINSRNEYRYEWHTLVTENAGFTIKLDKEENINCIYLYGTNNTDMVPAKISVKMGNCIIDNISLKAGESSPTVLYFDKVSADEITVSVDDFGGASGFALSEICLYEYN